jgi:hypothetical protein
MRSLIQMACAIAVLALASGSASAQQVYAGQFDSIKDTSAGGCGDTLGEHQFFLYRPKTDTLPGSFFISTGGGITALIQSADLSGVFDFNGSGVINGTLIASSGGGAPWVQVLTFKNGSYTIASDSSDPQMTQITKVQIGFKIKENGQKCNFQWNGVMTAALMPPP